MLFNLGNGRGYSIKEVIDVCRKVTRHAISVKIGRRKAGGPAILVASSEKIFGELGWRPQYPELDTVVETAWKWHKERS